MGLLIVGSLGIDSIETPFDKVENAMGGSSSYISITSSYFTDPVHMVGVVGDDFGKENIKKFEDKNIDLEGMQIIEGGKTFRWGGKYHTDFNQRDTLYTELGVFENFDPKIPEKYKNDEFILLGNIQPSLQLSVLDQTPNQKFVVCDTMNLWIDIAKDDLLKVIKRVNALIINDSEARELSGESNLFKAAKKIMNMGCEYLVIKKGEHGALLFGEGKIFSAPAYPLEELSDPTGAGDTFAGGFTAFLHKTNDLSFENMKRAVIFGSTMASFCVEKFSIDGIENLNMQKIERRFNEFCELSRF